MEEIPREVLLSQIRERVRVLESKIAALGPCKERDVLRFELILLLADLVKPRSGKAS